MKELVHNHQALSGQRRPIDCPACQGEPMTRTTHTPGPWTAKWVGGKLLVHVENGPTIVKVRQSQTHPTNSKEMDEANARLIAAAPELLEALEAFLRAPSSGSKGPGSVTIEVTTFNLDAAQAALAKARS